MAKEFKYEITEAMGILQESPSSDWVVELNKISWNDKPPLVDIRRFNRGVDAKIVMGKGVSISDEAANELANLLISSGYGDFKIIKRVYKERKPSKSSKS